MRQELQRYGHRRTLDYLVQMCQLVLDHTPLLPTPIRGLWDRGFGTPTRSEPEHGHDVRLPVAVCLAQAWHMITRPTKTELYA